MNATKISKLENLKKVVNRLNNLEGKEWVKLTRSVWIDDFVFVSNNGDEAMQTGILLSQAEPRDDLKKRHPATFPEKDVEKLISFFTKEGEVVFDPFMGTGSAGIAALRLNRKFIGIELYPEWFEIAQKRIQKEQSIFQKPTYTLYLGDSLEIMRKKIQNDMVDFIITSPPYWNILNKIDRKVKKERLSQDLPTNYGLNKNDLAYVSSYQDFLEQLKIYFFEMFKILKVQKYIAVVVSDFRHKERYFLFHADIANLLEKVGFTVQGLIILVQNNKNLYAYGYPTTFVPNINNQFVVIARKIKK